MSATSHLLKPGEHQNLEELGLRTISVYRQLKLIFLMGKVKQVKVKQNSYSWSGWRQE